MSGVALRRVKLLPYPRFLLHTTFSSWFILRKGSNCSSARYCGRLRRWRAPRSSLVGFLRGRSNLQATCEHGSETCRFWAKVENMTGDTAGDAQVKQNGQQSQIRTLMERGEGRVKLDSVLVSGEPCSAYISVAKAVSTPRFSVSPAATAG